MEEVVNEGAPVLRQRKPRREKATMVLSPRCSITVMAEKLDFGTVIESLEIAVKEAKKASSQMRLSTFLLVMEEKNSDLSRC